MARTWSNIKRVDTRSAAQRARNRPSGLTVFVIMLVLTSIFFLGLTLYSTWRVFSHPPSAVYQLPAHSPQVE